MNMCVGIAQHQMYLDRTEKSLSENESFSINYPIKQIKALNPKSFHINLGKQAVVIPQENPSKPFLATFGWTDQPKWSNRPFFCYNVRVEGSKSKGGNPKDLVDYDGEFKIRDNFLVKHLIRNKRCLIPCDFFIEQPEEKKNKRKFIIKKQSEEALHLAGIYNELVNELTGEITYAFTILTTAQSEITAKVEHKRSPLIIENEHLDFYLNENTSIEQLEALYIPPSSAGFIAYEVDPIIAKVKLPEGYSIDDERLIKPIGEIISV